MDNRILIDLTKSLSSAISACETQGYYENSFEINKANEALDNLEIEIVKSYEENQELIAQLENYRKMEKKGFDERVKQETEEVECRYNSILKEVEFVREKNDRLIDENNRLMKENPLLMRRHTIRSWFRKHKIKHLTS